MCRPGIRAGSKWYDMKQRSLNLLVCALLLVFILAGCRRGEETPQPTETIPSAPTEGVAPTDAVAAPTQLIVNITPPSGPAGTGVVVTMSGLQPNTQVNVGIGQPGVAHTNVTSATTDGAGNVVSQITIPADAVVGAQYEAVIEVPAGPIYRSAPFIVTEAQGAPTQEAPQPTETTAPAATTAPGGTQAQFTQANIYLVSTDDGGPVGCGDTLVAVQTNFEPTVAPLTAALNNLLAIKDQFYGESGLYNALYQSDLAVQGINIQNGRATIALTGTLLSAGVCDDPRIIGQLRQTALQFSTVNSVVITVNGVPIESLLSGAGRG